MMYKILSLILTILFFTPLNLTYVSGNKTTASIGTSKTSDYLSPSHLSVGGEILIRAETDTVFVYKNPSLDSEKLFLLTKSYFALAVSYDEYFYEIAYADGLSGYIKLICYVKKSDVKIYAIVTPDVVYPSYGATVITSNTYLYDKPSTSSTIISVLLKDQTIKCYGSIFIDTEEFIYCKSGYDFGYIEKNKLSVETVLPHPIALPSQSPPPQNNNNEFEDNPTFDLPNYAQILIIIAILIPTITLIYYSHKRK